MKSINEFCPISQISTETIFNSKKVKQTNSFFFKFFLSSSILYIF